MNLGNFWKDFYLFFKNRFVHSCPAGTITANIWATTPADYITAAASTSCCCRRRKEAWRRGQDAPRGGLEAWRRKTESRAQKTGREESGGKERGGEEGSDKSDQDGRRKEEGIHIIIIIISQLIRAALAQIEAGGRWRHAESAHPCLLRRQRRAGL